MQNSKIVEPTTACRAIQETSHSHLYTEIICIYFYAKGKKNRHSIILLKLQHLFRKRTIVVKSLKLNSISGIYADLHFASIFCNPHNNGFADYNTRAEDIFIGCRSSHGFCEYPPKIFLKYYFHRPINKTYGAIRAGKEAIRELGGRLRKTI